MALAASAMLQLRKCPVAVVFVVSIVILAFGTLPAKCDTEDDEKRKISQDSADVSSREANGKDSWFVTPADKLHDCGLRDKCPENGTTLQSVIISPEICRCDVEECLKYGDCCWSVIENRTLSEEHNPWQCHVLEVQNTSTTYALMISECPETSHDEITKRLCIGHDIPPENYTYIIDLPVYSNRSDSGGGILYKNIYCARCHNERNTHIVPWTMQLACNQEFTPPQQAEFMQAARYVPGERIWEIQDDDKGNETKCALKIAELREFEIQNTIPNVRYCPPRAISSCPKQPFGNVEKLYKLCASYAQYVMHRVDGTVYKNPHCAMCNEQTKDPIPLSCRRPSISTTFFKVRPGEAGVSLPGAGLTFLFDFGLGGNKYVGYEMLCGEDEIWDYIRQKCGPMICGTGYKLRNGECVRVPTTPPWVEIIRPNSSYGFDGDWNDYDNRTGDQPEGTQNEHDPECSRYRILLHQHEFEVLSDPPNAISITLPNTEEHPILLEWQYERINETTISICAKHLHHAFGFTFSTTLNYVSLISVGLSVFFSGLHIILYLLLPKLRNPPGRNLFCLTMSLFTFQLLFLTVFTHDKWQELCITAAIVMHYFSLAAFFWMNIMSFDMWRTFSNTLLRRSHSSDGQKFAKYSLYAWCMPGIIVLTAVVLDFGIPAIDSDGEGERLSGIRPFYGDNGLCWITQRLSLFIFFALPVACVITLNVILFSFTANAIFSQHKEASRVFKQKSPKKSMSEKKNQVSVDASSCTTAITSVAGELASNGSTKPPLTPSPSKATHASNRDKVRLMLYVNMALIMGLGWILGFASQFLQTVWMQYAFVVVNGLQGTFIFFAFDFKRKVYRMLKDRFYHSKIGQMFGLERSSSSLGLGTSTSTSTRRGTRSSNLISSSMSSAEDERRRRKISQSVK